MAQGQFAKAVAEFAKGAMLKEHAVFVNAAAQIRGSIQYGSAVTGAPPIPVAESRWDAAGALRDSITLTFPDATTALIYTTKWYAPDVEENPRGVQFTSGGPHGWALTAAASVRIVEDNAKRLGGAK
jgi:hypothetical protein